MLAKTQLNIITIFYLQLMIFEKVFI